MPKKRNVFRLMPKKRNVWGKMEHIFPFLRVLRSGDKCSVLALQDSGIITKLHPKCKLYGKSKSHAKKTGNPSMVVMAFGSNLP